MSRPISRRAFIALGGGAMVAGLLATRVLSRGRKRSVPPGLAAFFPDEAAAQRIGRAYLDGPARSDDPRHLARLVAPDRDRPREWLAAATPRELAVALAAQTRTDFATGRVVSVGGWQLAESEAALCAYYTVA